MGSLETLKRRGLPPLKTIEAKESGIRSIQIISFIIVNSPVFIFCDMPPDIYQREERRGESPNHSVAVPRNIEVLLERLQRG